MLNFRVKHLASAVALSCACLAGHAMAAEPTVDVLNWWTSGSESKAMGVLQQMLSKQGIKMVNDAVAGGGGGNARTILKSRIVSGNVPGAAQIKGVSIQQWGQTGLLGNMNAVAKSQHWNKLLDPAFLSLLKYDGNYVAVPFDNHRVNWMWVNPKLLKKAGVESVPATWDELVVALKKIKAAGIIPIAGGGNTWQVATEFGPVVLATGGPKFYNDAFVKLDPKALNSPTMVKAFERLRVLQKYTDPNGTGRSWNHDTAMVANGQAAMQFMGDWAEGTLMVMNKTPGKDVQCAAFPGTNGSFIYNVDTMVFFKQNSASARAAQAAMAKTVMSEKFQILFNKVKGSIPARMGTPMGSFNACAQKSAKDFTQASKNNALVPSMSQNMSTYNATTGAIFDVLGQFYNSNMSAKTAAEQLAKQVAVAKSQL
ncbi:MAG: ABC transporter substrate-binding protein [Acidihalobacter sp.]|uniref:ABC transporter substrate-binding protein n=1 Tax=Acidihalobacter sp. TaxID=1872108 RepID=UPI00307DFEA3